MGPRAILPSLFTPSIYFLILLSVVVTIIFLSCVWSFVNIKAGGIDNPSVLFGSKVTCCVWRSRWSKQPEVVNGAIVHFTTYLYLLESYGRQSTLASSLREICCYATSHLPLRVTNEERENYLPDRINQISIAVAGDSSLQDRGVAHYLLSLLFSLVSLPFSFYFCVPY